MSAFWPCLKRSDMLSNLDKWKASEMLGIVLNKSSNYTTITNKIHVAGKHQNTAKN